MQTSSTLNFQVQHQVANDHVKVIYSRPNNNREVYGIPPVLNAPIGIPVQHFYKGT